MITRARSAREDAPQVAARACSARALIERPSSRTSRSADGGFFAAASTSASDASSAAVSLAGPLRHAGPEALGDPGQILGGPPAALGGAEARRQRIPCDHHFGDGALVGGGRLVGRRPQVLERGRILAQLECGRARARERARIVGLPREHVAVEIQRPAGLASPQQQVGQPHAHPGLFGRVGQRGEQFGKRLRRLMLIEQELAELEPHLERPFTVRPGRRQGGAVVMYGRVGFPLPRLDPRQLEVHVGILGNPLAQRDEHAGRRFELATIGQHPRQRDGVHAVAAVLRRGAPEVGGRALQVLGGQRLLTPAVPGLRVSHLLRTFARRHGPRAEKGRDRQRHQKDQLGNLVREGRHRAQEASSRTGRYVEHPPFSLSLQLYELKPNKEEGRGGRVADGE